MTTESTSATTASELGNSELLRSQIEQFTNYNQELVGGGSVKKIMSELQAKSADLFQVPPEEIVVIPGYNPRVHNAMYYAGIADLAKKMADNGYMKDKPLAVYISKIDGKDRLVLQDGHRRHASVMFAKAQLGAPIKTVPVIVKDKSLNSQDLLKEMLHANEATPFTVYEKAVIAKRFKSFGWADRQIAEEMGCTPAYVGQLLALAGAPDAIQKLVESGQITSTMAQDIMKEHGEDAVEVAQAAVATAKAKGKARATMKDVATPKDQKTKNARKIGYELYFNLKKLREDPAIEKRMDAKLIEVVDELIATVEKVKKPKPAPAPKPIKVKPAPAAKKTSAKKATKKLAPWDQAKEQRPQAQRGER